MPYNCLKHAGESGSARTPRVDLRSPKESDMATKKTGHPKPSTPSVKIEIVTTLPKNLLNDEQKTLLNKRLEATTKTLVSHSTHLSKDDIVVTAKSHEPCP
jgi:hypothetical protein